MLYFFLALLIVVIIAALIILNKIRGLVKQGICPKCLIKQYTKATQITMELPRENYDNGVALTPPMGWSSWNAFREKIDEDLIKDTAAAMEKCGLLNAGYKYVNLDDCWQSSMRDDKDRLQGDLTKFPSGMPQLVKDINSIGLKLGLYTSNGTLTCEDLPASLGREQLDAITFALWGVEFFKYDFCHNVPINGFAPSIEGISVGIAGNGNVTNYYAKDAELFGLAKIIKHDKLPTGEYIGFLGNGAGKAKFSVTVEYDGEYVLTLLMKKALDKDKYLQIWINNELYEVVVPPTKSWSATGRHQIMVELKQGENEILMFNPIVTRADSAYIQYQRMGNALKLATSQVAKKFDRTERPIVFSICEWGTNFPWNWGAKTGNLWRTTPDIFANWKSILLIYERTIRLAKHTHPGAWNDPDMLEVGNGKLTKEENMAHFSLWCMMSAPLILGNDIRKFIKNDGSVDSDNETLKIITNSDLIAVDQDVLGISARRIKSNGKRDILAKPLANGDIAICLLNKFKGACNISFDITSLAENELFSDLANGSNYDIRELWTGEVRGGTIISSSVPSHSCQIFRVSKSTPI